MCKLKNIPVQENFPKVTVHLNFVKNVMKIVLKPILEIICFKRKFLHNLVWLFKYFVELFGKNISYLSECIMQLEPKILHSVVCDNKTTLFAIS